MSPKPKRLSGAEVVTIFRRHGFRLESQRGSHAKLVRTSSSGSREILTVPMHREMDVGTLHAIIRQANRFIAEDELRPQFFTD